MPAGFSQPASGLTAAAQAATSGSLPQGNEDTALEIEGKSDREATMDALKFLRLLQVRLASQGMATTGLWMFNVFNRLVLDTPIRRQCQVTPQLFVGAQFRKRGWKILQAWGINGVVNLRSEFDDLALGLDIPAYLHLPTVDDTAPTMEYLQQGVAFITQVIAQEGKVYIHCGAGVGRAPTMAAAYLISRGDSPQTAWERIRKVRKFIRPTRVQRELIEQYAAETAQP